MQNRSIESFFVTCAPISILPPNISNNVAMRELLLVDGKSKNGRQKKNKMSKEYFSFWSSCYIKSLRSKLIDFEKSD